MMRFLERKDVKELISQSSDFHKRLYGSLMKWISYGIILIAFAFALNVNKVLYEIYSGVDMVLASDVLLTIIYMAVVGMIVIGYLLAAVHNLRYLLNAIEFQSAMFSGAARANTKFLLIANSKNTIVYADIGAVSIFSEKHLLTMDEFIEHNITLETDREKIRIAIKSGKQEEFSIIYRDTKNNEKNYQVSITPIEKPKGYFSIKGI